MSTQTGYTLIKTVENLHFYLKQALRLEHATIPPYLTALYSIKPGKNVDAFHIIRQVAVEEMLHLSLVSNVLNAVGGSLKGTLTHPDFIPNYPTPIPTGASDFQVDLIKFSPQAIATFMKIERAEEVEEDKPLVVARETQEKQNFLTIHEGNPANTFYSIGLFYAEIIRGLNALYKEKGDALFCGDPKLQITPEYYYNGGGDIIEVTDLRSAIRAIRIIQEQGEGSRIGAIYDAEREMAHFYRFEQLTQSKFYTINHDDPLESDSPHKPSGESLKVNWDEVYPIKTNATLADYPEGELRQAAVAFQKEYSKFLAEIEASFTGEREKLIPAVGAMFRLKELAAQLIRNPIPGNAEGLHGAPVFRVIPNIQDPQKRYPW